MSETRRLTTTCDCGDPAHLTEFVLQWWHHDPPELYVAVQLNPRLNVWGRCWAALQYVAGKRSHYGTGHWDSGSIDLPSAQSLRGLLDEYIAAHQQPNGTTEVMA